MRKGGQVPGRTIGPNRCPTARDEDRASLQSIGTIGAWQLTNRQIRLRELGARVASSVRWHTFSLPFVATLPPTGAKSMALVAPECEIG